VNATVLFVGVALEWMAVNASFGFNQPLYADELIVNNVTYNVGSLSNQSIKAPAPTLGPPQDANIKLETRLDGQATLTNETTHIDSYSAKLVIPSTAQQGSASRALMSYNKSLSTLSSFGLGFIYNRCAAIRNLLGHQR